MYLSYLPTPLSNKYVQCAHFLLILRSSRTSDNLHQFTCDNRLSRPVIQNLEPINHVAGVLGSVVHGVAACGLFAGVAFSERPEKVVCEGVFFKVGEDLVVDFEGGEVGYVERVRLVKMNFRWA